jgi:uncharacterized membrane protein (DUF2068 family)
LDPDAVKDTYRSEKGRPHWLADLWLQLIAGFKLLKATLLVAAGVAAIGLLNPDMAKIVTQWAMDLAADRHYHVLDMFLVHLLTVDERTLRLLSVGSFLYAALFYTEGFGLFFDKRWAEYLTIVTTAGLIPFEVFELHRHVTAIKLEVLIANVGIVAYLVWRVGAKLDGVNEEPPARAVG